MNKVMYEMMVRFFTIAPPPQIKQIKESKIYKWLNQKMDIFFIMESDSLKVKEFIVMVLLNILVMFTVLLILPDTINKVFQNKK